jgi:hypothetical protein
MTVSENPAHASPVAEASLLAEFIKIQKASPASFS